MFSLIVFYFHSVLLLRKQNKGKRNEMEVFLKPRLIFYFTEFWNYVVITFEMGVIYLFLSNVDLAF